MGLKLLSPHLIGLMFVLLTRKQICENDKQFWSLNDLIGTYG
jgi:hypothetical protein